MISICIPWRTDHGPREADFKFVLAFLEAQWPWPETQIVVCDSHNEIFSRSASRNKAAEMAMGDTLVFLDADTFVSRAQIEHAVVAANTLDFGWCFPYDTYYALSAPGSLRFMMGQSVTESDAEFVFPGPDPVDRPASVGGCVVVRADAFALVGGYDERFIGWSFEDRAFAHALETLYPSGPRRVMGPIYHLWHPAPEAECFGQPHMEANRALGNRYRDAVGDPQKMAEIIHEKL